MQTKEVQELLMVWLLKHQRETTHTVLEYKDYV
jgi:hypothetical protein